MVPVVLPIPPGPLPRFRMDARLVERGGGHGGCVEMEKLRTEWKWTWKCDGREEVDDEFFN